MVKKKHMNRLKEQLNREVRKSDGNSRTLQEDGL